MATKPKLDADLSGELVDQTDYHSKIRSLMYLASSRPDIVQAVCYCARYQAKNGQKKHLKEYKKDLSILKRYHSHGTLITARLRFDTRKSTSGGIQFLSDKLVSWMSKKQDCTGMSSAEAEYVALSASWKNADRYGSSTRTITNNGVSNDVLEHPSDTYVLTMKMEILLEPASNKLLDSHKDGDGDALFQLKSDSLPHAHAQTTKTYYKHRDSRIMKAQELKTKTSAQTLIYKIFLQRYQVYQGRLLASFQDDAKYEHVGQDTRSQGGKDDQDGRIKI
ncbi:hypothetical protein Tco_0599059 [Tanacetum coccineum]